MSTDADNTHDPGDPPSSTNATTSTYEQEFDLDLDALKAEIEHYRSEKQHIRELVGQIGGTTHRRQHLVINIAFLLLVVAFFGLDLVRHVADIDIPFLPPMFLLEIAVLLVSLKIIWMIHVQSKVDHFQFWVLHSIEFRVDQIARRLGGLEKSLEDARAEQAKQRRREQADGPAVRT